jgi:hypothetical protein
MIALLQHPLKPRQALLVALLGTLTVAAYCVVYTALAGRAESLWSALAWGVVNVLPWVAAFEFGKRAKGAMAFATVAVTCLGFSLAASAFIEPTFDLVFELVRRVPSLAVVSALLIIGRMLPGGRANAPTASLPLQPAQIEWIAAAGNYVEIHAAGRTILHRAPISRVEAELARHGFVRVHRSTLVRRDRIARVRPLDIVLQDGTSLRTGHRYRSGLRD